MNAATRSIRCDLFESGARMSVESASRPESLGIYVQVPFCQTKCTYCNFHTGVAARSLYRPYAQAVAREITEHAALYSGAGLETAAGMATCGIVDTIYLGGGTPSLLDPADLSLILEAVRAHFACELVEVTLEADPETICAENSAAWRLAGINRVSLGRNPFRMWSWPPRVACIARKTSGVQSNSCEMPALKTSAWI